MKLIINQNFYIMFRKKPFKCKTVAGSEMLVTVQTVVEGNVTLEQRKPVRLPVENFSLENQLKAGVPLKEVNCKVLSPDYDSETVSSALDRILGSESDTETQIETETETL